MTIADGRLIVDHIGFPFPLLRTNRKQANQSTAQRLTWVIIRLTGALCRPKCSLQRSYSALSCNISRVLIYALGYGEGLCESNVSEPRAQNKTTTPLALVSLYSVLLAKLCSCPGWEGGGGGGTARNIVRGCTVPFPKLTLTEICDILHPIYDLALEWKPCFRPALQLISLFRPADVKLP